MSRLTFGKVDVNLMQPPRPREVAATLGAVRLCDQGLGPEGIAEAMKPCTQFSNGEVDRMLARAEHAEAEVRKLREEERALLDAADGLLRWAQGLTDRDPERERLCRALRPMLRARMGRGDS